MAAKQYKIPEEELVLPTVPVFSVKSTAAANRHLSVIIPVSFGVWESVCLISCYEELMPVMHRYAESGGASMFEDAPLAWLNKQIQPFLAARGYQSSRYWRKWGFTCLAEDPLQIRKDILRKDTVQVKNAGGLLPYRNRTTYSIEEGLREGRIFFATVERRTILSAAVTHAGSKTPGIIEIGVETAPEARGRGLAAANTPPWHWRCSNGGQQLFISAIATIRLPWKTALKAGFQIKGKFFHYVAHIQS